MDTIKLISKKPNYHEAQNRASTSARTPATPVRGTKPTKSAPVKQAPPSKAPKAKKQPATGGRKAIVILASLLAVIFAGLIGIGAYASGLDTVFPNVTMEGVDLSGMTLDQAADALVAGNIGTDEDEQLIVALPAATSITISAKEAGCYLSAPDAAVNAYDECHGGSFFSNTFTYIRCVISGMSLNATSGESLDEDYVKGVIAEGVKQASLALMQASIEIGDDSIAVVKGASAVKLDSDKLFDTVKEALVSKDFTPIKYTAEEVSGSKAEELDLQALYDTIFEEPANAKYDPATQQASEHVNGRSFDIEAAQALWDEAKNGDQVLIPLIATEPEITTDKLNALLFADLLGQKSTSLSGSSSNRINNVTRAAAAINGLVLNPGEEFSYNGTVGQRTKAAGYLEAGAYSGGQVVQEVGGGICQVSSTLYYCTLLANLEITNRLCHYFGVSYLPAGLDATVSWPSPDFKFKNSSDYPIRINASVNTSKSSLTMEIYGSNPLGIHVEISTETWQLSDGYGARSYRAVYDKAGNLISKKEEATSRYYYHVSPSPSPSASPSPSPSPSASPSPSTSPSPTTSPSPSISPSPSASPSPTVAPSPSASVSPATESPSGT